MFHCYVRRSLKTGQRYVGSCENLDDRIRRRNSGESLATKHGVPRIVLYSETFNTRREALARERYYTTGRGDTNLRKFSEPTCRRGDRSTPRKPRNHYHEHFLLASANPITLAKAADESSEANSCCRLDLGGCIYIVRTGGDGFRVAFNRAAFNSVTDRRR